MADEFATDPESRLAAVLDQQERRIGDIFRVSINALKDEIDLDELVQLLEAGRINEALERLQYAAEQLGNASTAAFIASGQSTADFLSGAGLGRVVFNQINVLAVAQQQANRLELIREFTNEQRRATSLALIAGTEGGINPIEQARNFRDSIGLTESQWRHVASYRRALQRIGEDDQELADVLNRKLRDRRGDAQILRAAREGKALPKAKIDWLIERYTARYIKHRSQVIGRTEALRAVHQGNEEMYRQAIADGVIEAGDLERTWNTRLDGRERETHLLLNGQKRGWGQVWQTRNGVLRYPGDPDAPAVETIMCRCAIGTRIRRR